MALALFVMGGCLDVAPAPASPPRPPPVPALPSTASSAAAPATSPATPEPAVTSILSAHVEHGACGGGFEPACHVLGVRSCAGSQAYDVSVPEITTTSGRTIATSRDGGFLHLDTTAPADPIAPGECKDWILAASLESEDGPIATLYSGRPNNARRTVSVVPEYPQFDVRGDQARRYSMQVVQAYVTQGASCGAIDSGDDGWYCHHFVVHVEVDPQGPPFLSNHKDWTSAAAGWRAFLPSMGQAGPLIIEPGTEADLEITRVLSEEASGDTARFVWLRYDDRGDPMPYAWQGRSLQIPAYGARVAFDPANDPGQHSLAISGIPSTLIAPANITVAASWAFAPAPVAVWWLTGPDGTVAQSYLQTPVFALPRPGQYHLQSAGLANSGDAAMVSPQFAGVPLRVSGWVRNETRLCAVLPGQPCPGSMFDLPEGTKELRAYALAPAPYPPTGVLALSGPSGRYESATNEIRVADPAPGTWKAEFWPTAWAGEVQYRAWAQLS